MSSLTLTSLIHENALGRLTKVFLNYSGAVVQYEYRTYSESKVGAPALKITYVYDGKLIGEFASASVWTQEMEDDIVNSQNGTPNNFSLAFNGVDQYVNFGDVFKFQTNTPFSVAMWVKPDSLSVEQYLYSKLEVASPNRGYTLHHDNTGQFRVFMRSSDHYRLITYGVSLTNSVWQHIVFTYDGLQVTNGTKIYKDTATNSPSSTNAAVTGIFDYSQNFTVGSRNTIGMFHGNIDELTVWDKALDQTEVDELYNLAQFKDPTTHSASASLLSWYRMGDNDIFPTISDNEGSNDGTMINMTTGNFDEDVF